MISSALFLYSRIPPCFLIFFLCLFLFRSHQHKKSKVQRQQQMEHPPTMNQNTNGISEVTAIPEFALLPPSTLLESWSTPRESSSASSSSPMAMIYSSST